MLTALLYTTVAGLSTFLGGLASLFLKKKDHYFGFTIGFSAGIMVFISFDELLPKAYVPKNTHLTILGIFSGIAIMAFSLYFLL